MPHTVVLTVSVSTSLRLYNYYNRERPVLQPFTTRQILACICRKSGFHPENNFWRSGRGSFSHRILPPPPLRCVLDITEVLRDFI